MKNFEKNAAINKYCKNESRRYQYWLNHLKSMETVYQFITFKPAFISV